ncbi:MAG: histidine ammonia-lyase [Bacteroidota bacterium]
MGYIKYGKQWLSPQEAVGIATGSLLAGISQETRAHLRQNRGWVEEMARGPAAIYGINTGFGPLCDMRITAEQTHQLQHNLLISHAVGVGPALAPLLVRLMMLTKVHALCKGYSGVRPQLVDRIVYFLDEGLYPLVPIQGSVGASGDLAPLAHLFLPLIGEGAFWDQGAIKPAKEVLAMHGLEALSLEAKEGLALINGTQFMLAHALLGLDRMQYLLDLADLAGAMSLEGLQGSASPFRAEMHELRPFAGNQLVAQRLRALLAGSENLASHQGCSRIQDPYSLRCLPQVHGASRQAWQHLYDLTEIELNSVTDNPLILNESAAISGGNFHGQPLAMALDYAALAAAELGNIADRRCYLLLEGRFGLPRLLTRNGGLNSGFMIPQYTTAALVSENKSLCFPASADSIPTSLGQEDHVSMGSISGRKFNQILDNLEKILAIELMYAAQAMEFRRPLTFSPILEGNLALIRSEVSFLEEDRLLKPDIDRMITWVQNRTFNTEIEAASPEHFSPSF